LAWSSLFLVKDLDSIEGLLHRRSTLDLGSVIIMAHDPGAVVKSVPWPSGALDLTPDLWRSRTVTQRAPEIRAQVWSRVRVANYPDHLTHTLVSRLTPGPFEVYSQSLPSDKRPGLKFYNLHQTLNTSINALNSFLDIYLISSARTGFVFFISFTSFFLTLICPHHILSGMSCQACCLKLAAWSVALFCRYLVSVTCESLKLEIQFAV